MNKVFIISSTLVLWCVCNCLSLPTKGNKTSKFPTEDMLAKQGGRMGDMRTGLTTSHSTPAKCLILPDDNIYEDIEHMIARGINLIEFKLQFINGSDNLEYADISNGSWYFYKPNTLYKAYNNHGKTLLSLAFNYDVMSLFTLTFGVETVRAVVRDEPRGCVHNVSVQERMDSLLDLVRYNMKPPSARAPTKNTNYTCYEIIQKEGHRGRFQSRCCRYNQTVQHCEDNLPSGWLKLLDLLLATAKVIAFLFGPLIIKWVFHSESLLKANYTITLTSKHHIIKTIKKVCYGNQEMEVAKSCNFTMNAPSKSGISKFKQFEKDLDVIKNGELTTVEIDTICARVDHRELMSEQVVPVGLIQFLYENLFLCRIQSWRPFVECCDTRILLPAYRDQQQLSQLTGCPVILAGLKWNHLARLCGVILTVLSIPIPVAIRLIFYYKCEHDEVQDRWNELQRYGLRPVYQYNIIHYLTPLHWFLLVLYVAYFISFTILAAINITNKKMIDTLIVTSIQDMNDISKTKLIEFMVAQVMLPFKRCGVYGCCLAICLWIFSLPLSLIIVACYCIPTIYLTGRVLIHRRPKYIRDMLQPSRASTDKKDNQAENERLLADDGESDQNSSDWGNMEISEMFSKSSLQQVALSLAFIVLLYSVLVMFSEVFGFLLEVLVFTLMGAIVNAATTAKYIMIGFWIIMYSTSCFNIMYQSYLKLNKEIFDTIQDNLKDDITDAIKMDLAKGRCIGFKYNLEPKEKKGEDSKENHQENMGLDLDEFDSELNKCDKGNGGNYKDTLNTLGEKLAWRLNGTVLFIDSSNTPRIPKKLFWKVCSLKLPGCPGPSHEGILHATTQLLYMVVFLLFVVIVLMSFGGMYEVSSSNQMLMTLAGGFLPFVVRYVFKHKQQEMSVGKFSFKGKLHNIIADYYQTWPMFDMPFKCSDNHNTDQGNENLKAELGTEGKAETFDEVDGPLSWIFPSRSSAVSTITDEKAESADIVVYKCQEEFIPHPMQRHKPSRSSSRRFRILARKISEETIERMNSISIAQHDEKFKFQITIDVKNSSKRKQKNQDALQGESPV